MTTIQETLVSVLSSEGLTVYPVLVPKNGTYPNVVYQMISNFQARTHNGPVMDRPRVQISCHGKTYATCVDTAETVKGVMDLNQTEFKLATRENEMDAKEVEAGIYRIVLDYFIWHKE